jgi:uncharacterized protein (DUF2141 family)
MLTVFHFLSGEKPMRVTNFKIARALGVASLSISLMLTVTPGFSAQVAGQKPETATLTVRVSGARNAKGKMGITLFQDAKSFPDHPANAIRQLSVDIDPGTLSVQAIFRDLPLGVYALAVLHDENGNGKMDKNFMGIPREGYGASNNPKKKMRAPTFDEAKFSLNGAQQTIEIKLIY